MEEGSREAPLTPSPPIDIPRGQQRSRSWENWHILVTKNPHFLDPYWHSWKNKRFILTGLKSQSTKVHRSAATSISVVWFDHSRSFFYLVSEESSNQAGFTASDIWSKISAALWYLIRQSRLSAVEGCNLRDKIRLSNLASEQGSGTFLRKWNDQYWFSCFFLNMPRFTKKVSQVTLAKGHLHKILETSKLSFGEGVKPWTEIFYVLFPIWFGMWEIELMLGLILQHLSVHASFS